MSNVKSQRGQLPLELKTKKAAQHISHSGCDEAERRESRKKFKHILASRSKNRRHQAACVLPSKCLEASARVPSSHNCTLQEVLVHCKLVKHASGHMITCSQLCDEEYSLDVWLKTCCLSAETWMKPHTWLADIWCHLFLIVWLQ